MSFECLFLILALVNLLRKIRRYQSTPIGANCPQCLFSSLEIYQISDKENKSVSSVYDYVFVLIRFVVFLLVYWGQR